VEGSPGASSKSEKPAQSVRGHDLVPADLDGLGKFPGSATESQNNNPVSRPRSPRRLPAGDFRSWLNRSEDKFCGTEWFSEESTHVIVRQYHQHVRQNNEEKRDLATLTEFFPSINKPLVWLSVFFILGWRTFCVRVFSF
jgi:hypothetical protein